MHRLQINRLSAKIVLVLSFIALLAVLSGYTQPPQTDEGAAAHIFQLAILTAMILGGVFVATADWKRPLRSARPLSIPTIVLVLAFSALYYLERFWKG